MSETSVETPARVQGPAREWLPVSPEEDAQWVKRFLESGLSLRKFAKQNDIPPMSLWRWVRRGSQRRGVAAVALNDSGAADAQQALQKVQPSAAPFAEVKLPASFGQPNWAVEVTLPNGTVLRLTKDTPSTLVDQLLRLC